MQKEQQELVNLIKGKKVAFIGAGVSHKTLIREFVEDRKSTRLNSSHNVISRMPSSA